MSFNYHSLRNPDENKDESPGPPRKPGNWSMAALWLVVAFVPSVLALALWNNSSPGIGPIVLVPGIGCCLVSGFGITSGMKDSVVRMFAGLLLAGVFFLLNVIIVVLIGCSGMGRVAP